MLNLPRPMFALAAVFGAVGVALLTFGVRFATTGPTPAPVATLRSIADNDFGSVPAFALTDQDGKPTTNADLAGKVWIASFVFTRCNGPCPAVTATVAKLQADLKDVLDVRFVTFTVDPKRDKPEELKRYAERYGADPAKWLFLTGPQDELHTLMVKGFKVHAAAIPNAEPGKEFDHSSRLVLVNKAGTICGYYEGFPGEHGEQADFDAGQANLKAHVRRLCR